MMRMLAGFIGAGLVLLTGCATPAPPTEPSAIRVGELHEFADRAYGDLRRDPGFAGYLKRFSDRAETEFRASGPGSPLAAPTALRTPRVAEAAVVSGGTRVVLDRLMARLHEDRQVRPGTADSAELLLSGSVVKTATGRYELDLVLRERDGGAAAVWRFAEKSGGGSGVRGGNNFSMERDRQ